ncbi:MAG TPA: hypothetical protein VMT30_03510 [Candidatus Saccharimonadia bacterium]|nr:hypothetical protein [Candidatus Saccharimonadia bacterium]
MATIASAPSEFTARLKVFNGQELSFDPETGLVTGVRPFRSRDVIIITVVTGPANLIGMQVSRTRDVARRANLVKAGHRYDQRVLLRRTPPSLFSTDHPSNNLRLAEVTGDGVLILHQYAVIGQREEVFLTYSRRDAQLYLGPDGVVAAPAFNTVDGRPWSQLLLVLEHSGLLSGAQSFPLLSDYQPAPEPTGSGLRGNEARVLWYDPAWGRGAAVTADGTAAQFDRDQLPAKRGRLVQPEPGQTIAFRGIQLNPSEHSAFAHLLIGVDLAASQLATA